jgi:hypothetical protein
MSKELSEASETSERSLDDLNKLCLGRILDYQNLEIYGKRVLCPYFINHLEGHIYQLMQDAGISLQGISAFKELYNNNGTNYVWNKGKGTPEQIVFAVVEASSKVRMPLEKASPGVIQQFMKLYGIGIDCSGFVYNVLNYAFRAKDSVTCFMDSLAWEDKNRKTASRAGCFVFADGASEIINPSKIDELDLILIKGKTRKYAHIAMVVKENDMLQVAQSQISNVPDGISLTNLEIVDGKPAFGFTPEIGEAWGTLYQSKKLEFRRLNILK